MAPDVAAEVVVSVAAVLPDQGYAVAVARNAVVQDYAAAAAVASADSVLPAQDYAVAHNAVAQDCAVSAEPALQVPDCADRICYPVHFAADFSDQNDPDLAADCYDPAVVD